MPVTVCINGSEIIPLNPKGLFKYEAKLSVGKNDFTLSFMDCDGNRIEAGGQTEFSIMRSEHMLKVSNAPMTHSVGVGILLDGMEQLDIVLEKNTVIPASNIKSYKLGRPLMVGGSDFIEFKLYEGEIYDNPMANALAGVVKLRGTDIKDNINIGDTVELEVSVDINGEIHVSGTIFPQKFRIPETILLTKDKVNLESKLDELEPLFAGLRVSIKKLGEMAGEYESKYEELVDNYDDQYDLVDDEPGEVYKYIKRFYDVQTAIIRKERAMSKGAKTSQLETSVNNIMSWIRDFGKTEDIMWAEQLAKDTLNEPNVNKMDEKKDKLLAFVDHALNNSLKYTQYCGSREIEKAIQNGAYYEPQFTEAKNEFDKAIAEEDVVLARTAVLKMSAVSNSLSNQKNDQILSEADELKKSINSITTSPNLDSNNDRVRKALMEYKIAADSGDVNKLREIENILKKNMIESAGDAAGNRKSDLTI